MAEENRGGMASYRDNKKTKSKKRRVGKKLKARKRKLPGEIKVDHG